MTDILKNKQILIIIGEIAVVIGVCFYFSQKTKRLTTQMEILAKKFEEQQELINKHEEIIHQLAQFSQQQQAIIENMGFRANPHQVKHTSKNHIKPAAKTDSKTSPLQPQKPVISRQVPCQPSNQPRPIIKMNVETTSGTKSKSKNNHVHFSPSIEELPSDEDESEPEASESELEGSDLEDELREELEELESETIDIEEAGIEEIDLKKQVSINKKN